MSIPTAAPILLRRFETPLGNMVGGTTEAGVCLCEFADRGGEARVVNRLETKRGRAAAWTHDLETSESSLFPHTTHLEALESQLREYFAGDLRAFDIPLDLKGTPWQEKVWSALLEIPYGATVAYGQLASRLGNPGGSRAVGRANGDNRVAIVVPCHRVVQADGGLRGYGGGLHRKRWLLDLEAGSQQLSF